MNIFTRRDFLQQGVQAGAGLALGGALLNCAAAETLQDELPLCTKPLEKVRIGFVGVGHMGTVHVHNLLQIEGVELRAVCDIVPEKVTRAQKLAEKAGQPKPKAFTRGPEDYKRLCQEEDLDLVYTATPWELHVPVCLAAMNNGKHAATEVPAAVTLEGCWKLVETAEKTKKHCVMLENCCYDRVELMILNMVRKGVLGTVFYGECGYLHDLRYQVKHSDRGEGLWRPQHSIRRNGNLYPTHGLGPVAQCMNVNRGDQFDFLVSMSSMSICMNEYAKRLPPGHQYANQKFAQGDVNDSLIRTKNGCLILVGHDTSTPRPYSRRIEVQGTKGLVRKYPDPLVWIEGRSKNHNQYDPIEPYLKEYEHPLWKGIQEKIGESGRGHGNMDYIENYRLIRALLTGTAPDMDVYDAAAWSAVSELSERSVAHRSRSVDFPDFTRGRWKTRKPLGIVTA
ncbi:MAG: Gfo/Idh/MocA family oxidoreductase [Pirellulales bacterium]|nr:Gfo/Idh/MocA family oxidoreductase [Pirellulales bacterium]